VTRPATLSFGLAGVSREDNARARYWQHRLHWLMVGIAMLSIPAYVLDTAQFDPLWHRIAHVLDGCIFIAFSAELVWMLHVTSFRGRYLLDNWLNLVILASAMASLLGASIEWIALVRIVRVALVGLVFMRILAEFRVLFTPRGAPLLAGVAAFTLAIAGALLYWLEPSVESYWDGLWLAFVTGTTVGYGDFVPTTAGARIIAALVVITGVALVAVFTASIVARFVGEDEKRLRRELHDDIQRLRAELSRLIDGEELLLRQDFKQEVDGLRREIDALRRTLLEREALPPSRER